MGLVQKTTVDVEESSVGVWGRVRERMGAYARMREKPLPEYPNTRIPEYVHTPILPYVVVLSVLTLLFFYRIVFSGLVLYWGDVMFQSYPWRHFTVTTLRDGQLPLWNPYIFCGIPFIANPQPAMFYPVNWLFQWLPVERAISYSAVFHVFLSGWFLYLFLRQKQLTPAARCFGAITFAFSGFLITKAQFPPITNVVPWLPLSLFCFERLREQPNTRRTLALTGAITMLCLGGHVQMSLLCLIVVGLYTVCATPTHPHVRPQDHRSQDNKCSFKVGLTDSESRTCSGYLPPNPNKLGTPCALCADAQPVKPTLKKHDITGQWSVVSGQWSFSGFALIIAFALIALQWLPLLELAKHSNRADYTFKEAVRFALPWWQLPTLLAPNFFGSPTTGMYWGKWNYFELCGYVGILPLVLAGIAVLGWSGRERTPCRSIRFWVVLAVVGLALSLGNHLPLYKWLYYSVPLFKIFRAPGRFLLWYTLSLSVLSAYGLDATFQRSNVPTFQRYANALKVAGVLIAGVALVGLMGNAPSFFRSVVQFAFAHNDKKVLDVPQAKLAAMLFPHAMLSVFLFALFLCAGGWWLSFVVTVKFSPAVLSSLAVALVALDLFLFGSGFNPVTSPSIFHVSSEVHNKVHGLAPNYRVLTPLKSIDDWWDQFANYAYFGSTKPSFTAKPIHSLVPNVNMTRHVYNAEGYDALRYQPYERVLRRMEREPRVQGSGFSLQSSTLNPQPSTLDVLGVRAVITATGKDDSPWRMKVNPNALPRAFAWDTEESVRLRENVILHDEVNRVTLDATLPRAADIVLTDVHYPGWRASVNGRRQPIQTAFEVVRSVRGERGTNHAQFAYRPTAFLVGAFITLSAIGFIAAVLTRHGAPTRPR